MNDDVKYCVSLWGECNLGAQAWERWLRFLLDVYFVREDEEKYVDIDAPGFSDQVLRFENGAEQERVFKRLLRSKSTESAGLYSVPRDFKTVSAGYSMSAVRTQSTISLVVRGRHSSDMLENPESFMRNLGRHIRWSRSELFETAAEDEPWFYVMGDNEPEDIDGFQSIRVWNRET